MLQIAFDFVDQGFLFSGNWKCGGFVSGGSVRNRRLRGFRVDSGVS
jgi:hypothetical protein